MRYQAVLFDLYGTLVEPFRSRESQRNLTEMAEVLAIPFDDFQRLWRETFRARETGVFHSLEENIWHVCQYLSVEREAAQVLTAARVRLDFYRRSLVPRDGSLEVLAALASAGLRVALVSNASVQTPDVWLTTPMARLVEVPVFSSTAGVAKPDPRIYQLAYEGLELSADACLYVGDGGDGELEGARQTGLHPVLIRVRGDDLDDPYRPEAKGWHGPTVSAVAEVLDLVNA